MSESFDFSEIPPLRVEIHPYRYTETTISSSTPPAPPPPFGSFICGYDWEKNQISVGRGSYQYPVGTNVDVPATKAASGKYVYAVIKQVAAGGLATSSDKFKIEIVSTTKDATNRDSTDEFVEWSNVLLAEVVGSGKKARIIQRRVGNLYLTYRIINGSFCLWPETTGGIPLGVEEGV